LVLSPVTVTPLSAIHENQGASALLGALNSQGYQFGLFSSDGFSQPLYRQALLALWCCRRLPSRR
jgi:membrane-anchored protein YejM (alkaline phosphatase superfamily)